MLLNSSSKKPEIEYPCKWTYKVIGEDVDKIIKAIEEAVTTKDYEVSSSNVSKKNNYFSLSLKAHIKSELERNVIYEYLKNHPDIKIVL